MVTRRRSFDLIVLIAVLIHRSGPSKLNTTSLSFVAVKRSREPFPSTFTHGSETSEDREGYSKHTEVIARDSEGYQGVSTLRHQARDQRCVIVILLRLSEGIR